MFAKPITTLGDTSPTNTRRETVLFVLVNHEERTSIRTAFGRSEINGLALLLLNQKDQGGEKTTII